MVKFSFNDKIIEVRTDKEILNENRGNKNIQKITRTS